MKSKLYVGLAKWLGTVALLVYGGVQIAGPMNTVETITTVNPNTLQTQTQRVASGVVLQSNGMTVLAIDFIPLTMTGGVHTYDLAAISPDDYGITGSGVIIDVGIAMVRNPAAAKFTIAFAKSAKTASSSLVLATTNNLTVATGATVIRGAMSGSLVTDGSYKIWNGADLLTVKSLTNPTATGSGYLIIRVMDTPAE